jgi:serine/threonine protein kinase
VFWELLAMRRLFPADQPEERIESILRGGYPRPSKLRPELPAALDEVVMRALELSPDARFATIAEFSKALEPAARAASRREIGDWVSDLARLALNERTRMVARLENWAGGPQIPLSSSPFASEIPLPLPTPLAADAAEEEHIATALKDSLATNAAAIAKASANRPAKSSNRIWILLAILIAGIVGYVVHR